MSLVQGWSLNLTNPSVMGQTSSIPTATVLLALQASGILSTLVMVYYGYTTLFRSSKLRSLKGPRDGSFWFGHMLEETEYEPSMLANRWVKEHGPVLRSIGSLNVRCHRDIHLRT